MTSQLSIVVNPVYILRHGLYREISALAPKIHGDVLDFGCGSKPYESLFTNSKSYIGVDLEVSGHNHNTSKVDHFYNGKTLPFPENSFDAVVCFEVLEHVFNLDQILSEISRVLKPSGYLLLSVPFAWDEHEVPYDFARYTSFGIAHIVKSHRFEIKELIKTTTYLLAIFQMLIAYLTQHVLPKGPLLGRLSQVLIIFPLNISAIVLNAILPKRQEYFCNSVILGTSRK